MDNSISYLAESFVGAHNKFLIYHDMLECVDSRESQLIYQSKADYYREISVNLSASIREKVLERVGYKRRSDGRYVLDEC